MMIASRSRLTAQTIESMIFVIVESLKKTTDCAFAWSICRFLHVLCEAHEARAMACTHTSIRRATLRTHVIVLFSRSFIYAVYESILFLDVKAWTFFVVVVEVVSVYFEVAIGSPELHYKLCHCLFL